MGSTSPPGGRYRRGSVGPEGPLVQRLPLLSMPFLGLILLILTLQSLAVMWTLDIGLTRDVWMLAAALYMLAPRCTLVVETATAIIMGLKDQTQRYA